MRIQWTEALEGKSGIKDLFDQIIEQTPESQRGLLEMAFDSLASYTTPQVDQKLEKLEVLEDHGVEDWDGYEEAMGDLSTDHPDYAGKFVDDEDESESEEEDEDDISWP